MVKNQKTSEDTYGNQVYVLPIDNAVDKERLQDFLEQHEYNFFTASKGSEPFRQIQHAVRARRAPRSKTTARPTLQKNYR